MTPRERFQEVISDAVRDRASVCASLDLAERVAKHFVVLIDRYLQAYRSPSIPPTLSSFYADLSPRMLMYGLFTHFICFGNENRSKFERLDQQNLLLMWEKMATRALSILNDYSRDNQGFPDALFQQVYAVEGEQTVRESGAWWLKRKRIEVAMRDRFATGVVLGMAIYMETEKV